ncbi:MAG: helix-turn-helix domain-containing protein [Actinomycetota bacterium]|nr:helix-turn-helix domain-containing protein [Actinomycetota bacterium]
MTVGADPATPVEPRVTITVEEAAALLGIGRSAAYEAARRGQLPTRRVGRRLLVPLPALLEWLGAHRASAEVATTASLAGLSAYPQEPSGSGR